MVMLGAFGYFVVASVTAVFSPDISSAAAAPVSDAELLGLVTYEIFLLALIGPFLVMRGWRWSDVGMAPTLQDTGMGLVLTAAGYMGYIAAWSVYSVFISQDGDAVPIETGVQASTAVLLSVVNGFFEELFVCGYLINALKKRRSVVFAINVSVAIRLAYHLYQGPIAVPSILPMALIFGYWFAKTGRLWPLVVAHALMDFLALSPYIE
ncbi:CPBP family intramembrane glutamic endopeptidase [Steroidobacter flavus]|uniref:CPBP family intramembrane glutamic endopeptidase n=1 Tax=Steroidobacter flavus TaxID=1842136 RepID=A0ABV8SQ65_9GAMM